MAGPELVEIRLGARRPLAVQLVEELQGQLPRLAALAHSAPPAEMRATAEPLRHLERRERGFLAAIADRPARALPCLLLCERGDHAESDGHPGGERRFPDSRGRLTADEVEVGGAPLDDDPHAGDAGEAPRPGKG